MFHTLFEDLRNDNRKFFNYFHMSVGSFDELHGKLKNVLQRQNGMQPIEMLAMTLRYLASGCMVTKLRYSCRVGISMAKEIVEEVCAAICSVMREECIPTPNCDIWKSIASKFENIVKFPDCLGCINGKLIRLTCPFDSGSMNFNYKDFFSIVRLAVADADYRFVYADVGSYGRESDLSIFKKSKLWRSIESSSQPLPEEQPLPGIENPKIPYFFLGDESFDLHKHLLRPFGGKDLTVEKRVFNYRLSRVRRHGESAFAILSNKWHVFHRPIDVQPHLAVLIVNACTVLHNYVRDRDGYVFEDSLTITGLENLSEENTTREDLAEDNIRSVLSRYFLSEVGSLPWQMSKI